MKRVTPKRVAHQFTAIAEKLYFLRDRVAPTDKEVAALLVGIRRRLINAGWALNKEDEERERWLTAGDEEAKRERHVGQNDDGKFYELSHPDKLYDTVEEWMEVVKAEEAASKG